MANNIKTTSYNIQENLKTGTFLVQMTLNCTALQAETLSIFCFMQGRRFTQSQKKKRQSLRNTSLRLIPYVMVFESCYKSSSLHVNAPILLKCPPITYELKKALISKRFSFFFFIVKAPCPCLCFSGTPWWCTIDQRMIIFLPKPWKTSSDNCRFGKLYSLRW